MLYEIKNNQGKVVFRTEQIKCVPASDIEKEMKKSGYSIYVDGKMKKIPK